MYVCICNGSQRVKSCAVSKPNSLTLASMLARPPSMSKAESSSGLCYHTTLVTYAQVRVSLTYTIKPSLTHYQTMREFAESA